MKIHAVPHNGHWDMYRGMCRIPGLYATREAGTLAADLHMDSIKGLLIKTWTGPETGYTNLHFLDVAYAKALQDQETEQRRANFPRYPGATIYSCGSIWIRHAGGNWTSLTSSWTDMGLEKTDYTILDSETEAP